MSFIPERLREVRIRNGHTTDALAKQCGVTKQVVSKYETGQTIPSANVLQKIVEYYDLPVSYLVKENILPAERSAVFYRVKARMSQRELDSVQVSLKWLYEIITAVREIQPLLPAVIPFVGNCLTTEEKAQAVRRAWGLDMGPIDDLADVLKRQGIHLFTAQMKDAKIDGYSQLIGKEPIIILNQDRGSLARKNFSLAHEVGHLMLHVNDEFDGSQEREDQADEFAGCFLLPEITFRREAGRLMRINAENIKILSKRWHVSPQAVVERCFKLNMLGDNLEEAMAHRQMLFRKLNPKGIFETQKVRICSLENALRKIDSDEQMRTEFLDRVCLPVHEIQNLCQLPGIFEKGSGVSGSVDDMDGVQLSFV